MSDRYDHSDAKKFLQINKTANRRPGTNKAGVIQGIRSMCLVLLMKYRHHAR